MRIDGHNFYVIVQHRSILTAGGAWLQRWIHFNRRKVAWLQCAGPKTDMAYVCINKEEDYEHRLYRMPHRFHRQISKGDCPQLYFLPHIDLLCFNYHFPDNRFANYMDHFHFFLDAEHCACKQRDRPKNSASWHPVKIFGVPRTCRTAFNVPFVCPEWEKLDSPGLLWFSHLRPFHTIQVGFSSLAFGSFFSLWLVPRLLCVLLHISCMLLLLMLCTVFVSTVAFLMSNHSWLHCRRLWFSS